MTSGDKHLRGYRSCLGADWRSQVAANLPAALLPHADSYLYDYRAYQRMLRDHDEEASLHAAKRFPHIAAARAMQASLLTRPKLELMVTAEMTPAEISDTVEIPIDDLATWEALYYDVRDTSVGVHWFSTHVVKRASDAGDHLHAARLKLARTGGPVAVRLLLAAEAGELLDVAEAIYSKQLQVAIKLDMALVMPILSARDSIALAKISADLSIRTAQVELQREQLAERCRQAREEFELARDRHCRPEQGVEIAGDPTQVNTRSSPTGTQRTSDPRVAPRPSLLAELTWPASAGALVPALRIHSATTNDGALEHADSIGPPESGSNRTHQSNSTPHGRNRRAHSA